VRTAHSASAIFLAAAFAGAQPSPQVPVGDCVLQYHSADAAVGISEAALSARSDKIIVRMASILFFTDVDSSSFAQAITPSIDLNQKRASRLQN